MKKSFKIGLAVAMIAMATIVTVFGADLPVNVVASGEKSVNLYFGEIEGKVWISLLDQDGHVFHSKTLRNIESYAMQYDLNDLPDGTYVLALERKDQLKSIELVISNGKVKVNNKLVLKPSVLMDGKMVIVSVDQHSLETWSIVTKDHQRNIVFRETMDKKSSPKRKYDLSKLPDGDYFFEFHSAGNSFEHRVSLEK